MNVYAAGVARCRGLSNVAVTVDWSTPETVPLRTPEMSIGVRWA